MTREFMLHKGHCINHAYTLYLYNEEGATQLT